MSAKNSMTFFANLKILKYTMSPKCSKGPLYQRKREKKVKRDNSQINSVRNIINILIIVLSHLSHPLQLINACVKTRKHYVPKILPAPCLLTVPNSNCSPYFKPLKIHRTSKVLSYRESKHIGILKRPLLTVYHHDNTGKCIIYW